MTVDLKDIKKLEKQVEEGDKLQASIYSSDGKKEDIVPITAQKPEEEDKEAQVKVEEVEGQAQEVQQKLEKQKKEEKEKVVTEETWKHRFEVMEGKFKVEIPRLHTQIQEDKKEINTLKDLIVKSQKTQPIEELKSEPKPEPDELMQIQISQDIGNKYVTAEDISTFGQPTIDLATRIASGITRETLENYDANLHKGIDEKFIEYDQKITPIRQDINTVKDTQFRTMRDWFVNEMKGKVSDYELYVDSPEFQMWLEQPDMKYPEWTNKSFFDAYNEQGNVDGATRKFEEYFQTINTPEISGEQINKTVVANPPKDDAESVKRPMFYNENNILVYEDGTPVVVANMTDKVVKTTNIPLEMISPPASIAGDESEGIITPEKPLVYNSKFEAVLKQIREDPQSVKHADFEKMQREVDEARLDGRLRP